MSTFALYLPVTVNSGHKTSIITLSLSARARIFYDEYMIFITFTLPEKGHVSFIFYPQKVVKKHEMAIPSFFSLKE